METDDHVYHRSHSVPASGAGPWNSARSERGSGDFAATVCLRSQETIEPANCDLQFHFEGIVLYQVANPRVNVFGIADLLLFWK